jgi:tRNA pseudouridine55 synthase
MEAGRQPENKTQSSCGILLLAKQSGKTSFASLSKVKRSLGTSRVGHTGTLDSFADGLLVVLTGPLTRLVPHITNFDKSYTALIEFGKETDTLDPTGTVIRESGLPSKEQVLKALTKFTGTIEQVPPAFSAIHVDGKRASDLMRSGEKVELKPRTITISSIELIDFDGQYALVKVDCSKGTYIRSLARDIARECGCAAHLKALRRTRVGPFELKDAAGAGLLKEFTIQNLKNQKTALCEDAEIAEDKISGEDIKKALYPMTVPVAKLCGFTPAILSQAYIQDFNSGRKLKNHSFYYEEKPPENCEFAVFYPDMKFAGVVKKEKRSLSYGFVIPCEQKLKVYSWEQITGGRFSEEFRKKGVALSIGSFDGTHIGHDSIFDSLIEHKDLAPGIVTFRKSTRGLKAGDSYMGDVSTLDQRMEFFMQKGFAFVIVIDFSADFVKIKGETFLSVLNDNCNIRYLAEGEDFRCGYKGACDINCVREFCQAHDIELNVVNYVDYLGKRVSSSRIRQDVLDKEFSAIQIMLRKPFEIDPAGFEWQYTQEAGQNYLVAKRRGIQVFPPDGLYNVTLEISGSEGFSVTKAAVIKLDSGLLRVLDSDGSLRGFVRSIQFCIPGK